MRGVSNDCSLWAFMFRVVKGAGVIGLCLLFILGAYIASNTSIYSFEGKKLKVVTSISILKDFVENIGGERVEVKSLVTGLETPHTFSPKPSDRLALLSSELFVKVGLGLEVWVDKLLDGAPEGLLVIDTSRGIEVLGAKKEKGEVDSGEEHHHSGNPHIWLDPENAIIMARHIADGLIAKSPEDRRYFEANYEEYVQKIREVTDELKGRVQQLSDRRVVVFPSSYPYFLRAFGFEVVAVAEEVHGEEVSARRLAEIIKVIREEKVKVVIAERQFSDKDARMIAEETGATIAYLTPLLAPQIFPETKDYIGMIRYNVEELLRALKGGGLN